MDQHNLRQPAGARHPRKRIGRGPGSGQGTYAGRGVKGQKKRGKVRAGFEGGQMPLIRRIMHKRGFRNRGRIEFQAVNLRDLVQRFPAGATVDAEALAARRMIDDVEEPFKVLASGELSHALTVRAPRLSAAAKQAITAAGGSFEELGPAVKRVRNRKHRRESQERSSESEGAAAAAGAEGDSTDGNGDGNGEEESD